MSDSVAKVEAAQIAGLAAHAGWVAANQLRVALAEYGDAMEPALRAYLRQGLASIEALRVQQEEAWKMHLDQKYPTTVAWATFLEATPEQIVSGEVAA